MGEERGTSENRGGKGERERGGRRRKKEGIRERGKREEMGEAEGDQGGEIGREKRGGETKRGELEEK